jgi:hypothetical protein
MSGTKRVFDGAASAQQSRGVRARVGGEVPPVKLPPSWMGQPAKCTYINRNSERCTKDGLHEGRCYRHPECTEPGCTMLVASGGSKPFCKAHGGGKRCVVDGCTKSAKDGTPRCIAHGGGNRCNFPECSKSAVGATGQCHAHINGGGDEACVHPKQNSLLTTGQGIVLHGTEELGPCLANAIATSVPARRLRSTIISSSSSSSSSIISSSSSSSSDSSSSSSSAGSSAAQPPPPAHNIDQQLETLREDAAECSRALCSGMLPPPQQSWLGAVMSYSHMDEVARFIGNLKYR